MPASVMVATWCLMMAVLGVRARPELKLMEISAVENRTVCPIVVKINEREDRIPRRIKELKCAADDHAWCDANRIPKHECCGHAHGNHVMECVEIRDLVVVRNTTTRRTDSIWVSVGCTCMVSNTTKAPSATPDR